VTTPRQFLAEVRRRTLLLGIASGGELSHAEAERQATRSVIAEQRGKPRATYVTTANPDRSATRHRTSIPDLLPVGIISKASHSDHTAW
jgi:hypothetical protein